MPVPCTRPVRFSWSGLKGIDPDPVASRRCVLGVGHFYRQRVGSVGEDGCGVVDLLRPTRRAVISISLRHENSVYINFRDAGPFVVVADPACRSAGECKRGLIARAHGRLGSPTTVYCQIIVVPLPGVTDQ